MRGDDLDLALARGARGPVPVRSPTTRPRSPAGPGVLPVESDGRTLAALIFDPSLDEDPELVRAVGAAAAIALENEARVQELKDSRERIVAAGDAERRRLERNLHDGAQQRLTGWSLQLRLLRNRVADDPAAVGLIAGLGDELANSLAELRELARGIHPSVLDHGLEHALESLTVLWPGPRPPSTASPGPALPAPGRAGRLLRCLRGARERRQVREREHRHGHELTLRRPAADPRRRRRRRRRRAPMVGRACTASRTASAPSADNCVWSARPAVEPR